MSGSRRRPLPKTTEECSQLLEMVLEFANSTLLSRQEAALKAVERLCKKRCTKALTYIVREFSGSSWGFKQRLADNARECL